VANIDMFDARSFTDELPRDAYMQRVALPTTYADHVEIQICTQLLGWRIVITDGTRTTVVNPVHGNITHTVTLLYTNGNHFDLGVRGAFTPPEIIPDLQEIEQGLRMQLAMQDAAAAGEVYDCW
jgi:hypothetical protein